MPNPMLVDLGLSYEAAMHGVQSAIDYDINTGKGQRCQPKHLRVGIDGSKSDMFGLACLLIDKGIITSEEYNEYMRLAMNTELANEEAKHNTGTGLQLQFR